MPNCRQATGPPPWRIYRDLNAQSPRNRAVALAYAKALTDGGDQTAGQPGRDLLRPLLDNASDPEIYSAYARASDKAGDSVARRRGICRCQLLSPGGRSTPWSSSSACSSATTWTTTPASRIQARIAELTPLVLELQQAQDQDRRQPRTRAAERRRLAGRLCLAHAGRMQHSASRDGSSQLSCHRRVTLIRCNITVTTTGRPRRAQTHPDR